MECKKRSKGSVWEFCYANKIFGMFGFEMRACGQKLVKFCTLTHIHTTAAKLVVRMSLLHPSIHPAQDVSHTQIDHTQFSTTKCVRCNDSKHEVSSFFDQNIAIYNCENTHQFTF